MVDSRFGRTERRDVGHGRVESWARPEAHDRDVRKPSARLPLVDTESLEQLVQPDGQPLCPPLLVGEDEHRDASRLAVAQRTENDRPVEGANRLAKRIGDRFDLATRAVPEKRQCDVEIRGPDETAVTAQ
jgi:hypothetical protein